MGLKKLGKAVSRLHRAHRKIGTSLAAGDIKGVKDGIKQAHAGHKATFGAVNTIVRQDTASLLRRHPELGLDPGLRALAKNGAPDPFDPAGSVSALPAPSPGIAFLQKIIAAQMGAQNAAVGA
ncbi:MAG: hypothetical protein IT384_16105 [Deltaproteobacteria bacterium]|nr:hypothetical protein [Deltaproteobacteria bacterium]